MASLTIPQCCGSGIILLGLRDPAFTIILYPDLDGTCSTDPRLDTSTKETKTILHKPMANSGINIFDKRFVNK
jgi:hypothetical protein